MQNQKSSDSDLERLRTLILGSEIEHLKDLDKRVDNIFDSDELRQIVTKSISKEIENNRDKMIDALYPIIGAMISKYVTQAIKEMMQNINNKIEDGLSFDRYKRAIKSKITGVSEMELLLQDSNTTIILSLFIIKKESGLLVAKSQLDDRGIDDPHMVASMASAIRDFINDWIKSHKSQSEVQILSYGDATLYIESAGSVYIIAFLNDEPDFKLRKSINNFFASIIKEYSTFFQTFDGDDESKEVESLSSKMYEYLNLQKSPFESKKRDKNRKPLKYILYLVLLISTIYITYNLNISYMEYRLETLIKDKTNQEIEVNQVDDNLLLKGSVAQLEDIYEIEKIIKSQTTHSIKNNLIVPIDNIIDVVESKDNKISTLNQENSISIDKLNEKIIYINRQLKKSEHQINQLKKDSKKEIEIFKKVDMKKEIISKLDREFENNKFYIESEKSLDFRDLHIFDVGKVKYNVDKIDIVSKNFEEFISILSEYIEYIDSIIIEGHTDSVGDEAKNMELSLKRASAVRDYLISLPIIEDSFVKYLIEIDGLGSKEKIEIDGVEDKEASRRIKIKLKLKDNI